MFLGCVYVCTCGRTHVARGSAQTNNYSRLGLCWGAGGLVRSPEFRIFGRPFGPSVLVDLGLSRRHGWICEGRSWYTGGKSPPPCLGPQSGACASEGLCSGSVGLQLPARYFRATIFCHLFLMFCVLFLMVWEKLKLKLMNVAHKNISEEVRRDPRSRRVFKGCQRGLGGK